MTTQVHEPDPLNKIRGKAWLETDLWCPFCGNRQEKECKPGVQVKAHRIEKNIYRCVRCDEVFELNLEENNGHKTV